MLNKFTCSPSQATANYVVLMMCRFCIFAPWAFSHYQNISLDISHCCCCCRWWKASRSWQHNVRCLILLSWGLGEAPHRQWLMQGSPAPELPHGKPTQLSCYWAGKGPRPGETEIMSAHCLDVHCLRFHSWNSTPRGLMTHGQAKGSRRPWTVRKIISLRHGNQSSD